MAKVKVVLEPGWEMKVQALPKLQEVLTDKADKISAKANGLSAGFRTKIAYNKGVKVGGKQPVYSVKPAIFTGRRSVALVHTGNYAAMKDNTTNNTLLKSL